MFGGFIFRCGMFDVSCGMASMSNVQCSMFNVWIFVWLFAWMFVWMIDAPCAMFAVQCLDDLHGWNTNMVSWMEFTFGGSKQSVLEYTI